VVKVGTSPHGQGHQTTFAQIVADQLQIPFEHITLLHGDTATVQEGIGTMGSRGAPVGGSAVLKAAAKVRAKALRIAAHMLEADENDLELVDGRFGVKGAPDQGVTMGEVALRAFKPHLLPEGFDLGLDETAFHEPSNLSYPSGAHCCVVEIDRDTGRVDVLRYVAVDDCGVVLNPLLAKGQIHGGVAQGIAQALFEEAVYDADGNLLTGTFVDYTPPSAADLPDLVTDRTESPAPGHPLGAKGVGEAGTIAATPAVINAIVDALSPLGVTDIDMPASPLRVWSAIRAAKGDRA